MQMAAPSFEFPRDIPASVHFVGALPILPNQAPLPPWADELDGSRKVVLVTQGTMANHDFGLLVGPTLAALADEPDLLVVVTAGGRPVDAIPGPIPGNARLASYLPFEWLLPRVDVMVTNGGYGSVNQALGHGIPLVTAGLTEDKADVKRTRRLVRSRDRPGDQPAGAGSPARRREDRARRTDPPFARGGDGRGAQ